VLPLPCSLCCDSALPMSPTSLERDSRSVMVCGVGGEEVFRGRGMCRWPSRRSRVDSREDKCCYALIAREGKEMLLCLQAVQWGFRTRNGDEDVRRRETG
jgi:hypothetical protein